MIQILSKEIADKIAAGEVVERPLSIVKELVENAIDAGAGSIIVEIQNGGKTYIRITDDGFGIPPAEVLLAFERHATSKIRTDEDLTGIRTLGFRGEALASIAAVSRIEMITKTKGEKTGTRVRIEGSAILEHAQTGCPDGTSIIVSDLFYNTPARYKFLKTDAAESTLIIDLISKLSLAYTNIRMRLINNGNILFSTQGKGNLLNTILTVHSRELTDKLVLVNAEQGGFSLEGYVSSPGYSKTSRKTQVFFVNGRIVSSKVMEKGVSDAYADKLFEGRYPVCFLFFKTAPEKLDVNIHPNKREVRFDDERAVTEFTATAIRGALTVKEAIPGIKFEAPLSKPQPQTAGNPGEMPERGRSLQNAFLQGQNDQVDIKNLLSTLRREEDAAHIREDGFVRETPAAYALKPFDMTALVQIGSIFATYVVAADEDALYLIDQHAAHERIFFERLMAQYRNSEKPQQILLTPFVAHVSYSVQNDAKGRLDALCAAGFDVEEFGPKAFLVKAIPMFMELGQAGTFIEYFLDHVDEAADLNDSAKIEKIISASCKNAVKGGDALAAEEIRQLVTDLSKCENPYSCPHGRPTFIRLVKSEIERMFKRT